MNGLSPLDFCAPCGQKSLYHREHRVTRGNRLNQKSFMRNSAILLVSCPDRKGVVASIAEFIFRHNGNILFADEHGDEESNLFLTRVEFDPADFDFDLAQFPDRFALIARDFQMDWRLG